MKMYHFPLHETFSDPLINPELQPLFSHYRLAQRETPSHLGQNVFNCWLALCDLTQPRDDRNLISVWVITKWNNSP